MEDNEIVVTDGVPETPTENEVETNSADVVDEVQENTEEEKQEEVETKDNEDVEKQIEERANRLFEEKIEARLARDRVKREREQAQKDAKFHELETIMKHALNVDNLDDVITKSRDFYKEQGISIPEIINDKPFLNERDEMILARADAEEIIKLGKSEMELEANRIAQIPEKDRSLRDKTIFNDICQKLVRINDEEDFKAKGYDTKILDDKDFNEFRNQFNLNVPVAQIYETYTKLNNSAEKPISVGSAKTDKTDMGDKFSAEGINQMTPEEMMKHWNNPAFRKVAGLE